jgi:hypothetical protein
MLSARRGKIDSVFKFGVGDRSSAPARRASGDVLIADV